jgi:hypothetical protein
MGENNLFEKKLTDEPYNTVYVFIYYVKDVPNNIADNLRIDVNNVYKGMTKPELKNEIDKIGDLVYQELIDKIGKENVAIGRKEINDRAIFF